MKRFAEQMKKRAEGLRLRTDEKAELRERLLTFMEYHPLSEGVDVRAIPAKEASQAISFDAWFIGRFVGGFAVLLFVMVPALAENALPGEALYPVKVRFNEEVRGALSSSPYQTIEWETERLERRLAEAQILAEAGRLTPEAEAKVADAIKSHTLTAKSSIDAIRMSDNDEATMAEISLSSALEVSAEVLTKRGHASGENSTSLLSGAVSDARASIAPRDENLSYDKLLSRIESETTRAYEYLDSLNGSVSKDQRSDINRRLADVKQEIELAASLKKDDEAAAAKQLASALGSTRKLISFMTNLDVRRSVTVEELVPIIPTEKEKRTALETKLNDATELVNAVEEAALGMATSSNDYIAITDTIAQYRTLEAETMVRIEAEDILIAEDMIQVAVELAEALKSTMIGLGVDLSTAKSATTTEAVAN